MRLKRFFLNHLLFIKKKIYLSLSLIKYDELTLLYFDQDKWKGSCNLQPEILY